MNWSDWRTRLAVLITVIWLFSYVTSVVTSNYLGVEVVTPLMLVAASYWFDSAMRRK